ncbi:MAG TPA: outer membrane protein, partial [Xanthobacteraceae bacterium]|nr:outer membrane protein [Xanthobacteraceae bacterium]
PVHAADLPQPVYKAPPVAPPVAYNWTGFYVGGNIGGGFASFSDSSIVRATTRTHTTNADGVIGGGQIGYNYQFAPNWVAGVEADFQGSSQKRSSTSVAAGVTTTETDSLPWFGTARGRIGFTPVDRWLVYATGGLAYGEVKAMDTFNTANMVATTTGNTTKVGWTVGGGVEAALFGNWTGKIEYLYIDLPNTTFNSVAFARPDTIGTHLHENIGRVGMNYRF